MVRMGEYNTLKVIKEKAMGFFLDDGDIGILLPTRFVPSGTAIGDELKVFLYHDGEDRPIATTQKPLGILGDIVRLKVVSTNNQGAFLDWGLMKDLFVPKSKQANFMRVNGEYLIKIVMDVQTGRLIGTEKLDPYLSNDVITVKEKDLVQLIVYRQTDLGYVVIINNMHTGVLHSNEIYRPIKIGDHFEGFIKNILPENKINVAAGKPGYKRIEDESEKILRFLRENKGYLPYHDKSGVEDIYAFFSMSKKSFKMTIGKLYKERKIDLIEGGIRIVENPPV